MSTPHELLPERTPKGKAARLVVLATSLAGELDRAGRHDLAESAREAALAASTVLAGLRRHGL